MGEGGGGISYTEFSYTILQGYDYLHLFDNFGVTLQLGGSDQWGNCLSGVDLIRKARGQEVHVLAHNLIVNKATGKKFGKSEEGAIWLDPTKTSPFAFYQFWLNTEDEAAEDYLKIFTELDKDAVDSIIEQLRLEPAKRIAQRKLAQEVTKIVHGEDVLITVEDQVQKLFGGDLSLLSEADLRAVSSSFKTARIQESMPLINLLVETGLSASNSMQDAI